MYVLFSYHNSIKSSCHFPLVSVRECVKQQMSTRSDLVVLLHTYIGRYAPYTYYSVFQVRWLVTACPRNRPQELPQEKEDKGATNDKNHICIINPFSRPPSLPTESHPIFLLALLFLWVESIPHGMYSTYYLRRTAYHLPLPQGIPIPHKP